MSLITRCPACETLFRVVPDQLRISEGWVRCGQCGEVFDASLHLLPAPPDVPAQPAAPDSTTDAMAPAGEMPVAPEPILGSEPILPDAAADEVGQSSQEVIPDEFSQSVASTPALPDPGAELSDLTFLRDKMQDSIWRRPRMRALLLLLSLLLLLGLAGQLVFHERDRIAALQPGLKPWLLALCAPLHCTLSPLRRIDAIVIDSSSFAKIQGDSYRLSLTIKNTADTALAVPAVELTLTDALDQPVLRRVFLASELGGHSDTLPAGAEWPASLALTVKTAGTTDRIAGYRVLTFYP